ncbi:alpha-L-glutamate ligase [Pseudidiomarina aestuarii]|uniref:Alpha-L-glutamate ligase n=1 Tax=Pseudidiomarina aestuarii TaxID=624146 RepID=A0A7Z6ZVP9_9GAMM|nr:alpha-L-glutamate ligase [Pseudidiomarina aestuarii]RUO42206.1 alpha-L-glutamate ligase [Pseudidiomarina aestuarii]
MRPIVIMHENEEWVVPLHAAFKARGVEAKEWFLDSGVIAYDSVPDDAVYYNRMSASSHTRGHRFAPELTRMALTWLEKYGRTVVNGTPALALETCKLSQYRALEAAGLKVPATRAVVGRDQIVAAATAFNQWPLILKPNRGGKGLGVARYDSLAALEQFVSGTDYAEPLDGIWLLQAYVRPQAPYITRAEFVGRQFIYTVQVNTEDGFELCPADVCDIGDSFCPTTEEPVANEHKFTLTDRYNTHDVIEKLKTFMQQAHVDVAGIEFIEDEAGQLYVYDVNTNTNYNSGAEQRAGGERTGMGALADYLIRLANTAK